MRAVRVASALLLLTGLLAGCGTSSGSIYRALQAGAPTTKPGTGLLDASSVFGIFDGADDYVVVPDSPSLDPARSLTLEAWMLPVRSDNLRDHVPIILKSFTSAAEPQFEYGLFVRDSPDDRRLLDFQLSLDGQRHSLALVDSGWRYNVWNHVVATYDGRRLALYLNGGRIATEPATGRIGAYRTPLILGTYLINPQRLFFSGELSDVAVYGNALTLEGVIEHYSLTPARSDYEARVRAEGAVGYWRFSGDGSTLRDLSGHGNDGTLRGGLGLGRVPTPPPPRPGFGS